jgi:hypothetical protein
MTKQEQHLKFTDDMEDAGREVEHYNGRSFYSGPAVRIEADELQDVIRETEVRLQWDQLGRDGLIVYPR